MDTIRLRRFINLIVDDAGQVQRLLDDGHEVLAKDFGHENLCHGQEAIGPEGLDQEQLMHSQTNGS